MSIVLRSRQLLQHVLPAVIRPLRVLWNQVIGFTFVVLALWATPAAVKSVREFDGRPDAFFRLLLTGMFIFIMAGFGIYSFRRAHKIPKQ